MNIQSVTSSNIDVPLDEIVAFCDRWRIAQFALFGSVLRADFRPDSDIDVLVSFLPDPAFRPDRLAMQDELEELFNRSVDVVYRRVVEEDRNYLRRHAILDTAQVIYERP